MNISIDREKCIGAASCIGVAPNVFELDDENKAVIVDVYGEDDETILRAAQSCPVKAIILIDEDTNETIFPE